MITKKEKQVLMEMAERCAGVSKGEKGRVVVVYSVLCSLYNLSKKHAAQKNTKSNISKSAGAV